MKDNDKKPCCAVIYTDGSAIPNPGPIGEGAHGYVYNLDEIGVKSNNAPRSNFMTTLGYIHKDNIVNLKKLDQSDYDESDPEDKLDKYLKEHLSTYLLVKPTGFINYYKSYTREGTNNITELTAIQNIIMSLLNVYGSDIKFITIKSDSEYALGIFNRLHKGDTMLLNESRPNSELFPAILDCIKLLDKNDTKLRLLKVKGHSDSLGNECADRLANLATTKSIEDNNESKEFFNIAEHKFWNPKINKHPFFSSIRQVFFNHSHPNDNIYYVMDYKKDVPLGKYTSESLFGYIEFKKPDPTVEFLKDIFINNFRSTSVLTTLDLQETFNRMNYSFLDILKKDYLKANKLGNRLTTLFGDSLLFGLNEGKANITIKNSIELSAIADNFKQDKLDNLMDITEYIYPNGVTIPVNQKLVKIPYESAKIVLSVSNDIPSRNTFNQLKKMKPKIYLSTLKISKNILLYHTIIDTDDSLSVWCNPYSNKQIIK